MKNKEKRMLHDDHPNYDKACRGQWWLHARDEVWDKEDWIFLPFTGPGEYNPPKKPKKNRKKDPEGEIDVRHINPAYFNPGANYSIEEAELFKEPSTFKHFKKRINLLLKRRRNGTLVFLPKGEGIFLLALKHYVLNEVPTQDKDLRGDIYLYLGKKLTEEEKDEINDNYAKYIQNFKTNLNSEGIPNAE
jgi:hypothetical protein